MNTPLNHAPMQPEEVDEQMKEAPKVVIENFFDLVHLHEVKEILGEIKEQLIKRSFSYKKGSIQYSNTLYFFERLEQLIDAVHLLR